MTDIVQRLRKHQHGFDRNGSHASNQYVCLCDHDADAAADEIDRLRGLLREARDFLILLGDDCGDPQCEECAGYRLRDRIDAALTIADKAKSE